jgi:hypothetical protein
LANAAPHAADEFKADLLALPAEQAAGVTAKQDKAKQAHWQIWSQYCHDMGLDPSLFYIQDPIPFLQVFMRRFADGRLAPSGKPVSARHAEDVVRLVGQTLSELGAGDYCKDPRTGRLDFCLYRQQAGYKKPEIPKPALLQIQ